MLALIFLELSFTEISIPIPRPTSHQVSNAVQHSVHVSNATQVVLRGEELANPTAEAELLVDGSTDMVKASGNYWGLPTLAQVHS